MSILKFSDNDKVGGVSNEINSLVITITIISIGVSQVLIYGGGSCDIMYSYHFF